MPHKYIPLTPQMKDHTGKRYGRLVALGPVGRRGRHILWLCRCDCGAETRVQSGHLGSQNTRSCGCLHRERFIESRATHGMSGTQVYTAWSHMIARCTNQSNNRYAIYGGRGIRVCDRWRNSFEAFFEDMGEPPTPRHTLDRIDVDGDYTPENCRWATQREQQNNRRNNRLITHNGETFTLAQWSRRTGLQRMTILSRIDKLGWSVEDALTTLSGKTRNG